MSTIRYEVRVQKENCQGCENSWKHVNIFPFSVSGGGEKYKLDQGAVSDIRDVLAEQQRGIQALMQCVKDDFRDLDVIVKKIKDD